MVAPNDYRNQGAPRCAGVRV